MGLFLGPMWGLGGLTFGLTMRYLGMSLGMAVALSYCSAFGTLMPPMFNGTLVQKFSTTSGHWIGLGIVVCLLGIVVTGLAGMSKDREMPEDKKKEVIKEFNFWKGILVATFSGIMSASFAYGLDAGRPDRGTLGPARHDHPLDRPAQAVRRAARRLYDQLHLVRAAELSRTGPATSTSGRPPAGIRCPGARCWRPSSIRRAERLSSTYPLRQSMQSRPCRCWANYLFCALAGVTWYMQFFFYTMGETQMGQYKFSSWTLHMASIIIFSSLWGIALKEWKGSSRGTETKLALGLALLIVSTMIIGYGNYLGALPAAN